MTDMELMREALALAREAAADGEVPVGCVIARKGEIVGRGRNRRERDKSALAHAELEAIREACEALGGTPFPIGEVAYQLPLFDFLPIVVQFWDADEDFPGQLMIKWDRNILQYMHFETTFYATGCLLQRILELMDT